jgi:hypothetical protein
LPKELHKMKWLKTTTTLFACNSAIWHRYSSREFLCWSFLESHKWVKSSGNSTGATKRYKIASIVFLMGAAGDLLWIWTPQFSWLFSAPCGLLSYSSLVRAHSHVVEVFQLSKGGNHKVSWCPRSEATQCHFCHIQLNKEDHRWT